MHFHLKYIICIFQSVMCGLWYKIRTETLIKNFLKTLTFMAAIFSHFKVWNMVVSIFLKCRFSPTYPNYKIFLLRGMAFDRMWNYRQNKISCMATCTHIPTLRSVWKTIKKIFLKYKSYYYHSFFASTWARRKIKFGLISIAKLTARETLTFWKYEGGKKSLHFLLVQFKFKKNKIKSKQQKESQTEEKRTSLPYVEKL